MTKYEDINSKSKYKRLSTLGANVTAPQEPTPRTDYLIEVGAVNSNQFLTNAFALCRKLERELAEAKKDAENLMKELEKCQQSQ